MVRYACIQGARQYNEDFAFSTSSVDIIEQQNNEPAVVVDVNDNHNENHQDYQKNKGEEIEVLGVFDGHGGTHAALVAKGLAAVTLDNSKRSLDEGLLCEENVEEELSNFYEAANALLKNEESGVVSILAVIFKKSKRVVFGWLGDCEGCVFMDDPCCFLSPLHKSVNLITKLDYAELKFDINRRIGLPRNLHERKLYAKTTPHHLGDSVIINAPWQYSVQNSTAFDRFCASDVQAFASHILPVYFTNKDDQHEYDMLTKKAFLDRNDTDVFLDVTKIKIGDRIQNLDTRLASAIQPTRSLGDNSPVNFNVIRDCCVMNVRGLSLLPTDMKKQFKCLLCSDGMFHFGAFQNISKLSSFFIDPFRFFKEYFYHLDQEVTLRIMAMGLLPSKKEAFESIHKDSERVSWTRYYHAVHWQECQRSWTSVIHFLRTYHMAVIGSGAFRDTYSFVSVRSLEDWLLACEVSMKWLEQNMNGLELYTSANVYEKTTDDNATRKDALLCHAAAHFAVLMGSQDNITVIVSSI